MLTHRLHLPESGVVNEPALLLQQGPDLLFDVRDPRQLLGIVPHHFLEPKDCRIEGFLGGIIGREEVLIARQHEPSEAILHVYNMREDGMRLELHGEETIHLFLDFQKLADGRNVEHHHHDHRQHDDREDQHHLVPDRPCPDIYLAKRHVVPGMRFMVHQ